MAPDDLAPAVDDPARNHRGAPRLRHRDTARDAPGIHDALDHPEAWTHLPARRPPAAAELGTALATRANTPGWQVFTVVATAPISAIAAGTILGTTSYLNAAPEHARLEIGATQYTPAAWGTVVNPEAKLLLLEHAFDALHVARVELRTDARNTRSRAAIARLGARHEGTLRMHHRRADGTLRDTELFAITAADWPRVRENLRARLR
ncbi:GNAT family N-acetyltransferase [Lolliginicoccus suaedae]|uniref:GNAT family N-acetyltransferase n=1 Tax=Lolliginicoccus suaedae TaxID=2605429 RepID=UPI001F3D54D8|nr:GNAT family protein [Lolliginicoccus suaedae]